jgi:hypothetical protein
LLVVVENEKAATLRSCYIATALELDHIATPHRSQHPTAGHAPLHFETVALYKRALEHQFESLNQCLMVYLQSPASRNEIEISQEAQINREKQLLYLINFKRSDI